MSGQLDLFTGADTCGAVKPARDRLISQYAAKFAADTICYEPPEWVEPTDGNLATALGRCVRPPHAVELPAIRAAFLDAFTAGRYCHVAAVAS